MTENSVTFTGACANEIIPLINRSFVYKAKEGRHVRMKKKEKKYHAVGTVLKSNTKIVERCKNDSITKT
jgi:hypothetical protein